MAKTEKSILIHRTGQLGDTICAIPAMRAIQNTFPEAKLTLLCDCQNEKKLPLAKDITEDLHIFNEYILYNPQALSAPGYLLGLLNRIRQGRYDILFYLMPEGRGLLKKTRDRAFFKAAGIKKIMGMDNQADFLRMQETDRLLALVQNNVIHIPKKTCFDLPVNRSHKDKINSMWTEVGISASAPVIAIGAGSKMPIKRWPVERFEKTGRFLINEYNAFLIVLGGAEDRETGNSLVSNWGKHNSVNWAGRTSYMESAEVLRRCSFYLGNDTGTMHLAAAAGTRCVAIFSARDHKKKWYPYGDEHIVLRMDIECEHCMLEVCAKNKMKCILDINIDTVIKACEKLLGSGTSPA